VVISEHSDRLDVLEKEVAELKKAKSSSSNQSGGFNPDHCLFLRGWPVVDGKIVDDLEVIDCIENFHDYVIDAS